MMDQPGATIGVQRKRKEEEVRKDRQKKWEE